MGRANETKIGFDDEKAHGFKEFSEDKPRLNLQDLLDRRKVERKIDKKTNILILSSLTVVGAVVLLILNL